MPGTTDDTAFASWKGWRMLLTAARAMRPSQDGSDRGSHGSGSGSGSNSGVVLCRPATISVPVVPSIAA